MVSKRKSTGPVTKPVEPIDVEDTDLQEGSANSATDEDSDDISDIEEKVSEDMSVNDKGDARQDLEELLENEDNSSDELNLNNDLPGEDGSTEDQKLIPESSKNKEIQLSGLTLETAGDTKLRVISTLSYIVLVIIIGIPVWWTATSVSRAPLPLEEMNNLYVPTNIHRESDMPLSTEYDILISIVNDDPEKLELNLVGEELAENLKPFLESINSVADFTVKTHWVYLHALMDKVKKIRGNYSITERRLPYTITPLERKTWSHLSIRPTLNLIIYAPKCEIAPLYILDESHEMVESNSFLSPRWGGIQILDVTQEHCENRTYTPDMKKVVSILVSQLKELIGLKGDSAEDIQNLKKQKASEMIHTTRRTLQSLAKLLTEISTIVITDEIAAKIIEALEYANVAEHHLGSYNIDDALKAAKIAFDKSETAFTDPSLLEFLYFPDDQKYAIYIPLYLPILIPVGMSVMRAHVWLPLLLKKSK